jgi:hypothetical protein
MARLSDETLAALPDAQSAARSTAHTAAIARPAYARRDARIGVVHLGVGNFHRAHQAVAFDDLLAARGL